MTLSPLDGSENAAEAYQKGLEEGRRQGFQQGLESVDKLLSEKLNALRADHEPTEWPIDTSVQDLGFDTRVENALRREGITTLGRLLQLSQQDLYGIRGFGPRAVEQIVDRVGALGYSLAARIVDRIR